MKLEFRHYDDNYKSEDVWDFVYLHGDAEYENTDSAPDLCLGNQPMPDIVIGTTALLNCTVRGLPAICVLHNQPFIKGRIALCSDKKGLNHALKPDEWR